MDDNSNTQFSDFDSPKNHSSYIKVIGVGGGGNNAVNHMFRKGIAGVDFIVSNTDIKALNSSPVPNKLVLGYDGMGAGGCPTKARKAAEGKEEEIKELFEHNTKMLFITAGMGGGTGTGAAPVIARFAKEIQLEDENEDDTRRILVVAVVTTPFQFEGNRRIQQALEGIEELRKYVDSILVINNEKLRVYGNLVITDAFSMANDVLLTAVKSIAEIITLNAYVNIDFRDVNTVMENSGTALMGIGEGEGENRARQAIEQATTSVLLDDNDIAGAKNLLLYFSYSPEHEITMDEMSEVTDYLCEKTGSADTNVIWGTGFDKSLGENIKITLIATGFEPSVHPIALAAACCQANNIISETSIRAIATDSAYYEGLNSLPHSSTIPSYSPRHSSLDILYDLNDEQIISIKEKKDSPIPENYTENSTSDQPTILPTTKIINTQDETNFSERPMTIQSSDQIYYSDLERIDSSNKYEKHNTDNVYSSIFAPAEIKRRSHMLVQVYFHLFEETSMVQTLAKESQKEAERRDYIPLHKVKKGDKVDVLFNVYGEILLKSEQKSVIWQGSFTKCSFDFFVPNNIDIDELFCVALLTVNNIPVGEMRFITNIVDTPISHNPIIIAHKYNKVFISYSHQDESKVKFLHEGLVISGTPHFFDRDYLKTGCVFPKVIQDYINSADLFVLCWSENAAQSEYVRQERLQALKLAYPQVQPRQSAKLSIYPVSIEPHAELPDDMKNKYHFGLI